MPKLIYLIMQQKQISKIFHILILDTSSFALKSNVASLKTKVDKADINILKNVPNNLSNLKSKVDKLDFDKSAPIPADLSKLCNVVKNEVVKKTKYIARIKII